MIDLTPEQTAEVAQLCRTNKKIPAIKLVREISSCGLMEAKDWVDDCIKYDPAFQAAPGEFNISVYDDKVYARRQNLWARATTSPNQHFDIMVGAVIAALRTQLMVRDITHNWEIGPECIGRWLGTLKIKNIDRWTTRSIITYVEGATRHQIGLQENPKSPKHFAHFSDRFERLAREVILMGDAELTLHTLMR